MKMSVFNLIIIMVGFNFALYGLFMSEKTNALIFGGILLIFGALSDIAEILRDFNKTNQKDSNNEKSDG